MNWIPEVKHCKLCGKKSFANEDDARFAAREFKQSAYPCPYGNRFHLCSKNIETKPRNLGPGVWRKDKRRPR